jgi:type VI secretion system protein VasG
VLPRLGGAWLDAFAAKRPLSHIAIGVADPSHAPAQALTFDSAFRDS